MLRKLTEERDERDVARVVIKHQSQDPPWGSPGSFDLARLDQKLSVIISVLGHCDNHADVSRVLLNRRQVPAARVRARTLDDSREDLEREAGAARFVPARGQTEGLSTGLISILK